MPSSAPGTTPAMKRPAMEMDPAAVAKMMRLWLGGISRPWMELAMVTPAVNSGS